MIPEDLEALALADAIGALDPDERQELEARIATLSPAALADVARLYDTAAALAAGLEQVAPPVHVRDRVLAATQTPSRYTISAGSDDWAPSGLPGIDTRVLAVDKIRGLVTMLIRAEPGATYPSHHHSGPEECYVVRGSIVIDGRLLRAGDFHHADEDSDHGEISTTEGAEVLLVGAIADYMPS